MTRLVVLVVLCFLGACEKAQDEPSPQINVNEPSPQVAVNVPKPDPRFVQPEEKAFKNAISELTGLSKRSHRKPRERHRSLG